MLLEKEVLGHPIRADIAQLDQGLHVLLTGGCCTHVGAVTLAGPGEQTRTLLRQAHKDDVVSRRWAEELCRATGAPACVACGIHYDNATKEQLTVIVQACEELLKEASEALR